MLRDIQILVGPFSYQHNKLCQEFGEVKMQLELLCPGCGLRTFDYEDYESIILLSPDMALIQFDCPICGLELSVTTRVPAHLKHRIQQQMLLSSTGSFLEQRPEDGKSQNLSTAADATTHRATVRYSAHLDPALEPAPLRVFRPIPVADVEDKAHIEYFRRQLEAVETVDEAISEIDAGYFRTKES